MLLARDVEIREETLNIIGIVEYYWKHGVKNIAAMVCYMLFSSLCVRDFQWPIRSSIILSNLVSTYTAKDYHLFKVVENRMQQCCAAHIVHSCQQHCSALLSLNQPAIRCNNAEQYCRQL